MYHGFMTHLFLSQNLKVLELNPGQLLPNSLERTMGVILEPEVGEEGRIFEIVDSLQPNAILFGDGGPGCRWVGNENGFAGETCWSTIPSNTVYPGFKDYKQFAVWMGRRRPVDTS